MTSALAIEAAAPQPSFFRLTPDQKLAIDLVRSDARHILLYGGSRSGKTYFIVRAIITRALHAPGSRHLMARFRGNAIKSSIVADTWIRTIA